LQKELKYMSIAKKLYSTISVQARAIGRQMAVCTEIRGEHIQKSVAGNSMIAAEKLPMSLDQDQLIFIAYLAKTGLDAIADGGVYDGTSAALNDSDARAAAAILRVFEQDVGARN